MRYVISHANCFDGSAAAYAAWLKFGDDATYLFCQYGDDMPELPDGAEVYFLDFFSLDWVKALLDRGCYVHVLDHHESALIDCLQWVGNRIKTRLSFPFGLCKWPGREGVVSDRKTWEMFADLETEEIENWIDITGFTHFHYEEERLNIAFLLHQCGAEMAWTGLHKSETPDLIRYVGDRDRWVWQLPNSEAVSDGLWDVLKRFREARQATQASVSRFTEVALDDVLDPQADAIAEFKLLDSLANDPEYVAKMVAIGQPLVEARQEAVQQVCQDVRFCAILGHKVPIVRADRYHSWVGHYLLDQYPRAPFAAVVRDRGNGVMAVELRSRPGFRVNRVARHLGGGGHPTAAGFRLYQVNKLKIGDRFIAATEMDRATGLPIQINTDPSIGYRWQIQPDASVQRVGYPDDVLSKPISTWSHHD